MFNFLHIFVRVYTFAGLNVTAFFRLDENPVFVGSEGITQSEKNILLK